MPVAIAFAAAMIAPRQVLAALLARLAYGLFYLAVAALVLGVPAGLAYLAWRWMVA